MLRVPGALLTFIVSVLLTLIFKSYCSHVEFKLEVCSWRRSSDSCARLWSSAKRSSLRASGSKLASFVILSLYMMNNNGDNTQPCLTPDVMSNQSVSPPDVRTALLLFAYMARMLSKSWPWMFYSSSVCHSLSLFTLSNAFSCICKQDKKNTLQRANPMTNTASLSTTHKTHPQNNPQMDYKNHVSAFRTIHWAKVPH